MQAVALSCPADLVKLDQLLDTHGATALTHQVPCNTWAAVLALSTLSKWLRGSQTVSGALQAPCARLQQNFVDSLTKVRSALRGSVGCTRWALARLLRFTVLLAERLNHGALQGTGRQCSWPSGDISTTTPGELARGYSTAAGPGLHHTKLDGCFARPTRLKAALQVHAAQSRVAEQRSTLPIAIENMFSLHMDNASEQLQRLPVEAFSASKEAADEFQITHLSPGLPLLQQRSADTTQQVHLLR